MGIPNAPWTYFVSEDLADFDRLEQGLRERFGYPMFVKPANAGSSVGVTKAVDKTSLLEGLRLAFLHDVKVLVEAAVAGKEVECAVLGESYPDGLPAWGDLFRP